jgi:monomeric isocitrate dehydrogenase
VDSILTNPEALSATIPTLPTAITLLQHAGYELVAVPRKGPR